MALEFLQNFAVVFSSEKIPTGYVYNDKYIWALYLILLHFLIFLLFDFYGRNIVSGSDSSRKLQQFQSDF